MLNNPSHVDGELQGGSFIKPIASVYSASQVSEWLHHIGYTQTDLSLFEPNLSNLIRVTRLSLLAFPFENTELHYAEHKKIELSPEGLFKRLVKEKKGYGSVCFALNAFYLQMLRGLGFRAYPGAARLNPAGDGEEPRFSSLQHQILFVQPLDHTITYLVDIGRGQNGLARPILLSDSPSNIVAGTAPPEEHRLIRRPHPSASVPCSAWELQVRCGALYNHDWKSCMQFTEAEFFDTDFDVWTYVGSYRVPDGPLWAFNPFTASILVVKEILLEDGENMSRNVFFRDTLTTQVGDQIHQRKIGNDRERIAVLRDVLGIKISEDDVRHLIPAVLLGPKALL